MFELADDRFGSYFGEFKTPEGARVSAMVYSYNSHASLYDVIVMSAGKKKWYRRNMRKWSEVGDNKIYRKIEDRFEL